MGQSNGSARTVLIGLNALSHESCAPILRMFGEQAARAFHLDFCGLDMTVTDPFGNGLTFTESLGSA
jgi:hypothetical protein